MPDVVANLIIADIGVNINFADAEGVGGIQKTGSLLMNLLAGSEDGGIRTGDPIVAVVADVFCLWKGISVDIVSEFPKEVKKAEGLMK